MLVILRIIFFHDVLQLWLSTLSSYPSLHLLLLRRALGSESQREAFREGRPRRTDLLFTLVLQARFYIELGIGASRTV